MQALDQAVIAAAIAAAGAPDGIDVVTADVLDSTNQTLLDDFAHRKAVLADHQTAARGRRGRRWDAPASAGLWLSFGYHFFVGPEKLSGLSLAVGLAVAEQLPGEKIGLKWPNDLVFDDAKLGGVLIELAASASGGSRVVIGIGLNLWMPEGAMNTTEDALPRTDLARVCNDLPDRNRLAARLITAVDAACDQYSVQGFAAFHHLWQRYDVLKGRLVRVELAPGQWRLGRADGIDESARLKLVDEQGEMHRMTAGEVRVRMR